MSARICAVRARAGHVFLTLVIGAVALTGCDDGEAVPADADPPDMTTDGTDLGPDLGVDPMDAEPLDALPDPEPDAGPDGDAGGDAGPIECNPALGFSQDEYFTAAYDLVVLEPTGGTGNYRFELIENNSDAIVNPLTGAYLAGALDNVVDRVRLWDTGCIGEAIATIYITDPLEIQPQLVSVASGQQIDFRFAGGSGGGEYSLVINNSQAEITPEGVYTAGPRLGRDVVKVRDPGTGLEDEAVVQVVDDPTLSADPPRIFLPVGARMPVDFIGGSGFFDVDRVGNSATYDPATRTFTGVAQGRTTFTFVDQFTPQRIEVGVDVAAPLRAALGRSGRNQNSAILHAPGDLNGDGYADAIMGHPEPSIESFADGAVMVYHGGPQGLLPEPVQVLNGKAREDEYGRAVTTADVDRDGRPDLIVGAWNDDTNGANAGAVYIYTGLEDGTFDPIPAQSLFGPRGGDQFGLSVITCDFNGDRLVDLAVSAFQAEDVTAEPRANNQGSVNVFLGSEAGFTPAADGGVLWGGQLTEGGEWIGATNLRLGNALAAGDFDGDGLCDLAASAVAFGNNSGAIYVYRGRSPDPDDDDDGGLDRVPSRVYAGRNANNLGRRLAMADINQDQRADIVAAQHAHDGAAGANSGAVRVFGGGPLAGPVRQYAFEEDADWVWEGDAGNDQRGISVATGLWTPDPIPDLIIGTWNDEPPAVDGEAVINDVGAVAVVPGRMGVWPEQNPVFTAYGQDAGALFGEAVAMLGDVDGDAQPDLAVTAPRDQSLGINVGRPFFVNGSSGRLRALELPGAPAGAQNGRAIAAVGDVNRDGLSDLVVGAPETPRRPDQIGAGVAYLYLGIEGGYDPEPAVTFEGHFDHSAADRFGFGAAGGDFDGDRLPDVFISAPREERPANLDPAIFAVDGQCPGRGNDQGAVYIYRGRQGQMDGSRPDFVYFGPRGGANMFNLLVADINDDGRDDLIVGGTAWNQPDINGGNEGGIQIVYGRDPDPDGRIRVVCDVAYSWGGRVANAQTGISLALMGDLDLDGCNDIAFGAFNENIDITPQEGDETPQGGVVRVLFGWNNAGCAANRPRMITLGGQGNRPQAGYDISAGNVVGTPETDLVVGAINHVDPDNIRTGAVYVIDGAWLAEQATHDPEQARPAVLPLGEGDARTVLYGRENGEQFGRSVRVVGGRVFVGRLFGSIGEATRVGGADVYAFGALGLARRVAAIAGETWGQEGLIGAIVRHDRSRPLIAIGGFQASGLATDAGAVYVYNLSGLR